MNRSALFTCLSALALGFSKSKSSGSSVRLTGGFQPVVDYKFRITVDTNIDFSQYLEDEEDGWASWLLFPDEIKDVLWEYFLEFSNVFDDLDAEQLGFEDFDLFLHDNVENFLYIENRILFNFWFIFAKPVVVSSEEELESFFDIHSIAEENLDSMDNFLRNKLMTFDPNVGSDLRIFNILNVSFLEYEWAQTYPCVIDVDTGKRYENSRLRTSKLRKR